jgi:alkaline phosphatase D
MNRRGFLNGMRCAALLAATGRVAAQTIRHDPFTLGVASGSPSADGMVLWTRLLAAAGGEPLPAVPIEVRWELAADAQFRRVLQSGVALAEPQFAHSVHVEIEGLTQPSSRGAAPHFWYRFMVADSVSAVGRTRLVPARGSRAPLSLALASCQNFEHGYFNAYWHMAREPLDCVLFVGDYIYEYGPTPNRVRQHNSATCHTLADYRARYALYKSDAGLQAAHAAFPWIVTWDDHEVENDYANDRAVSGRGAEFLARRAAAYRAYWEHQPLRFAQLPLGPDAQMFRRYAWGQTANLHVLDARQYRDYQVCTPHDQGGSRTITDKTCPERKSLNSSLLGARQEAWLDEGLLGSSAAFEIIGQQSIMGQMRMPPPRSVEPQVAEGLWNDSWDGYPLARQRALAVWARKKNVLSLGGDVHATYVNDLVADFDDPKSPVLATEIVGTSITSPSWGQATTQRVMGHNPHMRFGKSDQRGYTVLEVQGKQATAHLRVVDSVRQPEAVASTAASFVVESGRPGAQRV